MENCTLYSHKLDFDKVIQIVESNLPKAKIEVDDGGIQKSLVAVIKGGFFGKTKTLKINYRQRENPSYKLDQIECGLTQNLAGMVGFIQKFPAHNESVRNKFLHKVMSANTEMAFMAEPKITNEFEAILRKVVSELDAFIFTPPNSLFTKSNGQHFVDKDLNLILDTQGNCEIEDISVHVDAKYRDEPSDNNTDEQKERKSKSNEFLTSHGIKVSKTLPCISDSAQVQLRSVSEVIDRTYSLLVTAAKGEGVESEHLSRMVESKKVDQLSGKERSIYEADVLSDQDKAYATWRYESLYTMLWALGIMDDLKYPSQICDVQMIVGKLLQPSREEFVESVNMRDKDEILNELDKIYRMNWACVDARIKNEEVAGSINPSVVYERHYSLNWLTSDLGSDWDDVQTHT